MAQSRGKELAKNTLILTIGKISTQAVSFLLLPLYTAYLSKDDYGIVDLISTITTLLYPIVNMQIEQAVFRYMVVNRNDTEQTSKIISTGLCFSLFQIILFSLLFLIGSPFMDSPYKWFLLANLCVGILNSSFLQILRGLGDNTGYAITSFLVSFITIIFNIVLIVLLDLAAYGMLLGHIGGALLAFCYVVFRTEIWIYFKTSNFDKHILKELLSYSVPLIPNEISWWAIRASDRLVISTFVGLAANGIIAVANKFPSIIVLVYNIFGLAWTESVVLHLKEDDGEEYFSNVVNQVIRLFFGGSLLLIAVMPIVFPIMVNKEFIEAYNLLPLYVIGCLFNVIIGLISTVYIVHKKTREIAKTSVIAAIICIVCDLILVQFIGVYASPIASIIGFGSMMIQRIVDLRKYITITWDYKYLFCFVVVSVICLLCYYHDIFLIHIAAIICTLIFFALTNKSFLLTLIKIRKN